MEDQEFEQDSSNGVTTLPDMVLDVNTDNGDNEPNGFKEQGLPSISRDQTDFL